MSLADFEKPEGTCLKDRSNPSYFSPSHTLYWQCLTNKAVFSQNFPPLIKREEQAKLDVATFPSAAPLRWFQVMTIFNDFRL